MWKMSQLFGEEISAYSYISFCVIFFGYSFQTLALQYFFYYVRSDAVKQWKIQPNKTTHVGAVYGVPLLSNKPNRGPYHRVLVTVNLLVASCFAFFTTQMCVTGRARMMFDDLATHGLGAVALELLVAVVYENVTEYYWHRLMHLPGLYARLHKHHHFYKSPEPWDDMYIHPLEAAGYYCILYAPPFLFRMHYSAFLAYMVVMGLCGVLDHSGVHVSLPGLYNTEDHDAHHSKFEVNYAFPLPYMDLLHGTFEGEFLGRKIVRKRRN